MVPTPIVSAWCGTFSSPKKLLAASRRVTGSSVTRRVRLWRGEPGSLKPMWPVRPMPSTCKSMPPAPADLLLVALTILLHILRFDRAVGDVDVLRRDVDVVEEGLLHPAPVALRVVRLHGIIFIEIEGDDAREVEAGLAVEADQLAVEADWRGAGGQAEDGGPAGRVVLADQALDHQRHVPRRMAACGKDDRRDLGVWDVVGRHDRSVMRGPLSVLSTRGRIEIRYQLGAAPETADNGQRTTQMLTLTINGESRTLPDPLTTAQLLEQPRLRPAARGRRGQRRRRACGAAFRASPGRRRSHRGRHAGRRRRPRRSPGQQTAGRRQAHLSQPAHHRHRKILQLRGHARLSRRQRLRSDDGGRAPRTSHRQAGPQHSRLSRSQAAARSCPTRPVASTPKTRSAALAWPASCSATSATRAPTGSSWSALATKRRCCRTPSTRCGRRSNW